MIVIGFAIIVVELIHRMQAPRDRPGDEPAAVTGVPGVNAVPDGQTEPYDLRIDSPEGAVLTATYPTGGYLVLSFEMPDGIVMFKVIDPGTGREVGVIRLPEVNDADPE